MQLSDIWTASGVLLGFQTTSFLWRVSNEVARSREGDLTWLPPADIVNLAAMTAIVLGVFVAPAVGAAFVDSSKIFGLSAILFVGHCFCLAGHYEMFNPNTTRSMTYFPTQEKIAVGFVVLIAIVYLLSVGCAKNILGSSGIP